MSTGVGDERAQASSSLFLFALVSFYFLRFRLGARWHGYIYNCVCVFMYCVYGFWLCGWYKDFAKDKELMCGRDFV